MDEAGKPAGAWIDLCEEWAEDLGLELEVVYMDWPGILPALMAGKFDLAGAGMRITEERLASPDFIMVDPFMAGGVGLMVRKDSGIETWEDMEGKKLAVRRGEHSGEMAVEHVRSLVSEVEVVEYPGAQEAMIEILNGRVDGFSTTHSTMAYMIKTAPQGDELKLIESVIDFRTQSSAVRKELPELAEALNQLIAQYLEDGTLNGIYTKWYSRPSPVDLLLEGPPR